MRLVPESNAGKIQFFTTHVGPWAEHAAEIGTSPEEVAALEAELADAKAAYAAQQAAQQAAMSATLRLNSAVERMARRGAAIIQQVRARAAVAGNTVYTTALISPPAHPSPIAPPGTPTRFEVELQSVGLLTLRWKCKNPRGSAGTMYQVRRSINGGRFEPLATVGERSFVDRSVPSGTSEIIYEVRGVRSTAVGEAATQIVRLNGDGMRGIPVMQVSSRKAALIAA